MYFPIFIYGFECQKFQAQELYIWINYYWRAELSQFLIATRETRLDFMIKFISKIMELPNNFVTKKRKINKVQSVFAFSAEQLVIAFISASEVIATTNIIKQLPLLDIWFRLRKARMLKTFHISIRFSLKMVLRSHLAFSWWMSFEKE